MSTFESTSSIFCRSFSAKLDNITTILTSVDQWSHRMRLGEELCYKLKVILDEILANLHHHANLSDEKSACMLLLSRTEEFIAMDIEDQGEPFNPLTLAGPDLDGPLEDRSVGGLGIHLIRTLADQVEYRYEDKCNILSIKLKIG